MRVSVGAWSRAILARLGQICLGLLLALLLMEVTLQIGSRFTVWLRGDQTFALLGAGRRVAFFGDSNTFGLRAGHQNSYPQLLARRWEHAPEEQRVEALNLGVPGLNSSGLRQQFRGMLTTLRPDMATIMIGVNDPWTVPVPLDGVEANWHYRLWSVSRAYRFLYMLSKLWQEPRQKIEFKYAGALEMRVADDIVLRWTARRDSPDLEKGWPAGLRANLQAMISDARKAGVEPVLLTYPSEGATYGEVNRVIRETAAITRTRLIDLGAEFLRACPSQQCPELFFPDQHPTAAGHRLAAETLWLELSPTSGAAATDGPNP